MWTVNLTSIFGAHVLQPWLENEIKSYKEQIKELNEAEIQKFIKKYVEDNNHYDPLIKHMLKHEIDPYEYCIGAKYWESCGICHLLGKQMACLEGEVVFLFGLGEKIEKGGI